MGLLDQLKERRLFQIVIPYIAGGWIILQVVDQFADRGLLANVAYHVALVWFLSGLVATLLIGWHHGEKGKQKAPLSEIVILVLLGITTVGATVLTIGAAREDGSLVASTANPLEMRSVAVRYFEDASGSGEYDYLADALTEALIAELQQVQGLDVVSRNGSARFRDPEIAPDSVARALAVGTLVEGEIDTRGSRLRVHLRVLDGNGNVFRRATIEEPLGDLVTLRQSVVAETARLLRQWIGEEVRVRDRAETTSSNAAWTLVQRAERLRKDADESAARGEEEEAEELFRRADELLAEAEEADPGWVDPVLERAFVAYRRSRATRTSAQQAAHIGSGLRHAEQALAMDPTNARALEIRGTLNYWSLLIGIEADPAQRSRILNLARRDLEDAVRFRPSLATAHASLSHLYLYFTGDVADAVLAASSAYRQDSYLENVENILDRLFTGSLELGNFRSAKDWCLEGRERFPLDYRFVNCQLTLLMAPFETPDVEAAWDLLAELDSLLPGRVAGEFQRIKGEMMVGAVLGRAGRIDSARVVIDRASARVTGEVDPGNDLLATEAYARIRSDEKERAIDLLTRLRAGSAERSPGGQVEWWWRDLQDEPRFRRLWGLN